MATSPSALRTTDTPTPSASGGTYSPSQMAGQDAGQAQAPQAPSAAQATEVIRNCEQALLALAQSFPNAAPDIRRAIEGIRNVARSIVTTPGGSEPPAPRALA